MITRDARRMQGHGDDHPAEEEFDPQDMRNMGGLWKRMRTTSVVYLIGALALMGIFPLAGFWSKDEILLAASKQDNKLTLVLLIVGAMLTAFYMTRQLIMVFFGQPKTEAAAHASESPKIMTVPLMVLAFFSIFVGFINAALFGFTPFTTWLEGIRAQPEFDIPWRSLPCCWRWWRSSSPTSSIGPKRRRPAWTIRCASWASSSRC